MRVTRREGKQGKMKGKGKTERDAEGEWDGKGKRRWREGQREGDKRGDEPRKSWGEEKERKAGEKVEGARGVSGFGTREGGVREEGRGGREDGKNEE